MKLKSSLIILTIFALMFSACDWLFENDENKENPPDTGNLPGDNFVYEVGTTLIKTKWGQRTPYNDLFPIVYDHPVYSDENGDLAVDCGTTAAVQVIAFHRYPERANGTSTNLGPHNITMPLVNFEDYPFDWANIRNTYSTGDPGTVQERRAVAKLNFIYGMGRGGIGQLRTLVENFNYDRSIQNHRRSHYNEEEWEAMIREQLDAGLPVMYSGFTDEGGSHVFVIDGYDNTGRFHVNWGWYGGSDGWYYLDSLIPTGSPNDHYRSNTAVINIKKPVAGVVGSNVFALNDFKISKDFVSQNELFTVTFNLESYGYFIGGQTGVALVDKGRNIAHVAGIRDRVGLNLSTGWVTTTMDCFIPETVVPDEYSLQIVTRPTDGEWKIVTASNKVTGVPNSIPITVIAGEPNSGGYGQALTIFDTTETSVTYGKEFTVSFATKNITNEIYPGGLQGAALVDEHDNIIVIRSVSRAAINPDATRVITNLTCTIPNTVPVRNYSLRIVISTVDNAEWRIATLSLPGIPNSYDFEVK